MGIPSFFDSDKEECLIPSPGESKTFKISLSVSDNLFTIVVFALGMSASFSFLSNEDAFTRYFLLGLDGKMSHLIIVKNSLYLFHAKLASGHLKCKKEFV